MGFEKRGLAKATTIFVLAIVFASVLLVSLNFVSPALDSSDEDVAECNDGIDNDNNGCYDYPLDPGCSSSSDTSESGGTCPVCSNDVDDDSDGLIDYPNDPGCSGWSDNDEYNPPCGDNICNGDETCNTCPGDCGSCESPPGCGNGILEENIGEECDEGDENDDGGSCTLDCKLTYCGDGVLQTINGEGIREQCDDGNTNDGDGCDSNCQLEDAESKPECADGIDNDGDGDVDLNDGGCSGSTDNDETNCGDGECEGGENTNSCPTDCENPETENNPPQLYLNLDTNPPIYVNEGDYYSGDFNAYDPDGDTLSYSWVNKPSWIGWTDKNKGQYGGTAPSVTQDTEYLVKVKVSDGNGGEDTGQYDLIVVDTDVPNSRPNIQEINDHTRDEGSYSYSLAVTDNDDGDVEGITLSWDDNPYGLSIKDEGYDINDNLHYFKLEGTISVNSDQTKSVQIRASDGKDIDTEKFDLTIRNVDSCTPTESPESSCFDGTDNDCDEAADCADSDCQGGSENNCGDGKDNDCDGLIDDADSDCDEGLFCGDGVCNNGETCDTCSKDCGTCDPPETELFCGDGVCNNGETCDTCSKDCGTCDPPETETCPDGVCYKENHDTCSQDCVSGTYCGDGERQAANHGGNDQGQNEQCDDGNWVDGDGCDSYCKVEDCYRCGGDSSDPDYCVYDEAKCSDGGDDSSPQITSSLDTSNNENWAYENYYWEYDVQSTGGGITYTMQSEWTWISIDSGSGLISGTAPEVSGHSNKEVMVTATNSLGSDTQTFNLIVRNEEPEDNGTTSCTPSSTPFISDPGTHRVNELEWYYYDISQDTSGGCITYSLTQIPDWSSRGGIDPTIDSTDGAITGKAKEVSGHSSDYINITATNDLGSYERQYRIVVRNVEEGETSYACSDGEDNDGDGLIDYPNDPGCTSETDNDEFNVGTEGTACDLTDAYWSLDGSSELVENDNPVLNQQNVYLVVEGTTECNGESINFDIYEDDTVGDDYISSVGGTFESGSLAVVWQTQHVDDSGYPEYYFNAEVVGSDPLEEINSQDQGSVLLEVDERTMSQWCVDNSINICSAYSTEEQCENDAEWCNVASNSNNIDYDPDADDYECEWSSTESTCEFVNIYDGTGTGGDGSVGRCIYHYEDTGDTCDDDGFLDVTYTTTWESSEGDPRPSSCPVSGGESYECPAQIPLPFFNMINFIIAGLLIALVYLGRDLIEHRR